MKSKDIKTQVEEILTVFASRMMASDEATNMTTKEKYDQATTQILSLVANELRELADGDCTSIHARIRELEAEIND